MPLNGSTEARKLRSRLNHPIIDADGHWLEYGPVMREEFRKIGGDAAAEALAAATDRVPSALRMSLPERRRRRVAMEAFWGSPSQNALDRAFYEMVSCMIRQEPPAGNEDRSERAGRVAELLARFG